MSCKGIWQQSPEVIEDYSTFYGLLCFLNDVLIPVQIHIDTACYMCSIICIVRCNDLSSLMFTSIIVDSDLNNI